MDFIKSLESKDKKIQEIENKISEVTHKYLMLELEEFSSLWNELLQYLADSNLSKRQLKKKLKDILKKETSLRDKSLSLGKHSLCFQQF